MTSQPASSAGIEDLQVWLRNESIRMYEESLARLGLDGSKIQGKHLVTYKLDDLQNEKKKVKNELKVYDQDFLTKFKRAPTRQEKEPMRNLYMYYKRLKQYIDKREKMESQNPKTAEPAKEQTKPETKKEFVDDPKTGAYARKNP